MTDLSAVDPARIAPDAANPTVAEVMRSEVVFCLPSTPIDALAKLMADNDITEIPVLIDRRPVGYVRSRDILHGPTLLVDENAQLLEVIALMRQSQRTTALVMHEDESPVGMVTVREVAAHLARGLEAGAA